jgi:hypothetical protein
MTATRRRWLPLVVGLELLTVLVGFLTFLL